MQRSAQRQERWKPALAAAAAAGVVLAIGAWRRRRPQAIPGEIVPGDPARREDLIDSALGDSFPASDPPAYWAREPESS